MPIGWREMTNCAGRAPAKSAPPRDKDEDGRLRKDESQQQTFYKENLTMRKQENQSPAVVPTTTRRGAFRALTAAVSAVALGSTDAHAEIGKPPIRRDIVRQAELQEVLDYANAVNKLAWSIRTRLHSGADFERGKYGVEDYGQCSIEWYLENYGIRGIGASNSVDAVSGLVIAPVEDIREKETLLGRPDPDTIVFY